jgi:hypothetical protein
MSYGLWCYGILCNYNILICLLLLTLLVFNMLIQLNVNGYLVSRMALRPNFEIGYKQRI